MNKTNQFSAKTPYVTPWCKCAEVQFARLICASLGGGYGNGKSSNLWDNGGDDVHDYTDDENLL